MSRWTGRARESARRALALHGLRVVCLACRGRGRYYAERHEVEVEGVSAPSLQRLRNAPCPRCGAISLRSRYWVERFPDLAAEASRRARAVERALS